MNIKVNLAPNCGGVEEWEDGLPEATIRESPAENKVNPKDVNSDDKREVSVEDHGGCC